MSNYRRLFVVAVLSLAACDAEAELFDQAKKAVTAVLNDPESARFENLTVVKNSKGEVGVCGMVNAKNSMGGYVGFQPFGFNGTEAGTISNEDLQLLDVTLGHDYIAPNQYPEDARIYHMTGCEGQSKEEQARIYDEIYRECLTGKGGGECMKTRWAEKKALFKQLRDND